MHYNFSKKAGTIHRRLSRSGAATSRPVARTAISGFLPIVQAKLHIGAPNDKYEQEADRVADQVMRMAEPEPTMIDLHARRSRQRQCIGSGGGQELCLECQEELQCRPRENAEEFQAEAATGRKPSLSPLLEASIRLLRGRGEPLRASQRAFFEPRFRVDFSASRIHTGPEAQELAEFLNARAFTVGSDIVFGQAQYAPASSAGMDLLAHELTHVVQQGYAKQTRHDRSQHLREPQTANASPTRPAEGPLVQRQEKSSTIKGGTPGGPIVRYYETIIHDADPLPEELRTKLKAYFLITYEPKEFDMFTEKIPDYGVSEKESIQDEMEYLKELGYLVVYIERATENDLTTAFADPQAVMIFTTGHGDPPGVIRTTNTEFVEPDEIKIPAGSNLLQVIVGACHVGDQYEKWKEVLPADARLTAWTGLSSTWESVQFNSGGGFSDRQWGSLMQRVKSLPQLKNQQGEIYRVTEKGETVVIKNWETGEIISE